MRREETARPPKDQRQRHEDLPREDLVIQKVTETQNQRNAGQSIVQSLLNKGYEKPENPDLLGATPDGLSFNVVMPKSLHAEKTRRNNDRAKRMEGFKEYAYAKETTKEEASHTGQEILDGVKASAEHDG